jgi:hypothetical protein
MKYKLMAAILITGTYISCTTPKNAQKNTPGDSDHDTINSGIIRAPADGKSFETAIAIQEKTETPGVHAEYQWIRDHYSNYKVTQQRLTYHNKKPYDVISIEFDDGDKREVYFDISKFFGHL